VAGLLPAEKQRYAASVVNIDAKEKTVSLKDGTKIKYNKVRCL
jgi:NADH dehydrogenase FAD-containing subunit